MSDFFIGQVTLFAGNFAPLGWAFCQGQILSIAQNSALFAILGTTYGGDGVTTFALPDLRGRVDVHPGTGPGLPTIALGEMAGTQTNTLLVTNMAAHSHGLLGTSQAATLGTAQSNLLAAEPTGSTAIYAHVAPNAPMNAQSVGFAGGGQPVNNIQPYLGINFIICVEGIFPPHS